MVTYQVVLLKLSLLTHSSDTSRMTPHIVLQIHGLQANRTLLRVFAGPLCPANSVSCASETTFSRSSLGTTNCTMASSPRLPKYLRYISCFSKNCGFPPQLVCSLPPSISSVTRQLSVSLLTPLVRCLSLVLTLLLTV